MSHRLDIYRMTQIQGQGGLTEIANLQSQIWAEIRPGPQPGETDTAGGPTSDVRLVATVQYADGAAIEEFFRVDLERRRYRIAAIRDPTGERAVIEIDLTRELS